MTTTDFLLADHGSIATFTALSDAAQDHASEAFAGAMEWAGGYVVEPRYVSAILADLVERGFLIAGNGYVIGGAS